MQQWEYGYLYIVGIKVQERGLAWATASDREIAVVEDASGRRILGEAKTTMDALNALGYAGWIISDGRQGTGGGMWDWLRDPIMAAESEDDAEVSLNHETTYFMRRPIPSSLAEPRT